jgi:hypothetical protein
LPNIFMFSYNLNSCEEKRNDEVELRKIKSMRIESL